MELTKYLSDESHEIISGIHHFNHNQSLSKLNRRNVLEELGKGFVWKNTFAHYFRFLYVLRWIKKGTTLVDVGCGRAWMMDLLYRNRYSTRYIGVDLSQRSLEIAFNKPYKYPRLLIRADVCNKPLVGQFADYVLCLETIEHNSKKRGIEIIDWCKSILNNNGTLFISTPIKKGKDFVFEEDHIYEWEFNEMGDFLSENGLEIIDVYGCFGKKKEILESLDNNELILYKKLSEYYSWHVLSPFFSSLHPESSQGAIWRCKKRNIKK